MPTTAPLGPTLRRHCVRLLAALVFGQAIAAGVVATVGPAHTHRTLSTATIELVDFRRAAGPAPIAPRHVAALLGHFHGATPERHHHASGDASVVADTAQAAGDGEELSPGSILAAGLALLPGLVVGLGRTPDDVRAARPAWAPRTHDPRPLERPPRSA